MEKIDNIWELPSGKISPGISCPKAKLYIFTKQELEKERMKEKRKLRIEKFNKIIFNEI